MGLISLRKVLICTSHRLHIVPYDVVDCRHLYSASSSGATQNRWGYSLMAKWRCDLSWISLHTSPWWPSSAPQWQTWGHTDRVPEAHRDSNRLVIEGKVARCNWHCHRPVRRVKAGCRFQPGPVDQIISPEAELGRISFDHRPVPCALPLKGYGMAG